MVNLEGYIVNSINFENRTDDRAELSLTNNIKYNVNYKENSNVCFGMLDFTVSDVDMKPFEIRVQMAAQFTYEKDDDRTDIHLESFDQLFPFLRQIINNLTTMSGMPGLLIPTIKLNKDEVKLAQNNEAKKDDEGMLN